jgi:hypothetical protein
MASRPLTGLPTTADPLGMTSSPSGGSTLGPAMLPWPGVTGAAGRVIASAAGSSSLVTGAWLQWPAVAAPTGASSAFQVSASGDPTLDPIRIVDQEAASIGHASQARRASTLREMFFGWFGSFMAFTGANLLRLVVAAVGLMMLGTATLAASRRLSAPR